MIAALMVAAALSAFPGLSHVAPIALHTGVNRVPHMAPGRDGMIVQAHRDYFTADGSYTVFTTLIRSDPISGWSQVTRAVSRGEDARDALQFTDTPHTGEDQVRSVAFARARLEGSAAFVVLVAQRAYETTIPSPSHVVFTLYRLAQDGDDGFTFQKVGETKASACYGNTDLALHAELGLPLPKAYEGPKTAGVCGAD